MVVPRVPVLLTVAVASLIAVTVALGGAGYPSSPYHFNRIGSESWLRADDGLGELFFVKKTTSFGVARWELKLPPGHDIEWAAGSEKGCTMVSLFDQTVTCDIAKVKTLNISMRDLNDSFLTQEQMAVNFKIRGDDGSDIIRTSSGKDLLQGGNGNDIFYGAEAADTIEGGAGDDLLDGGAEADVMDCGSGTGDRVVYQGRSGKVTVTLDDVANDGQAGETDNVKRTCEGVEGWSAGDALTGSADANRLVGRDGNDTLEGSGGNDQLYGGNGDDSLKGDTGSDRLYGEAGADTITGGAGEDTVWGGDGNDITRVNGDGSIDTVYCGAGSTDVVYADANDRIDIGTCEQVINS